MSYTYNFNKEKCWYLNNCPKQETAECSQACLRYMEMHYLMNTSNIPVNRQYPQLLSPATIDLPAFHTLKNIKDNIVDYIKGGANLYIFSQNTGNGKTTWAIKLMQKFFDEIWAGNGFQCRGIFIHVPTFLVKIKEIISRKDDDFETLRANLLNVDLVIWDDIASTKLSDFDHANLLTYIDQRLLNQQSNIYTGNLSEKGMVDALGNRLASRIWNDSQKVEFRGLDRRGIK